MGLDAVFGAREAEVEFMPDIGDRIRFTFAGLSLTGGGFLQSYQLAGGARRGDFDDGRLAVVEHHIRHGRTLLVGTHPSVGYHRTAAESGRRYFAECLAWAGKTQLLRSDNLRIQVRAHRGEGRTFLWFVNATRNTQRGRVALAGSTAAGRPGVFHWANEGAAFDGEHFVLPPRDALVVELLRPEAKYE
jgi:beta-galactosidase